MQNDVPDESFRVVVDETAFDFAMLSDQQIESAVDTFSDALSRTLRSGVTVGVCSMYIDIECRPGLTLFSLIYETRTQVDRDSRIRLGQLLDRCVSWDNQYNVSGVPTDVRIDGVIVEAYSVGYALALSEQRCMACLTLATTGRQGLLEVSSAEPVLNRKLLFFTGAEELPRIWRRVLEEEDVHEGAFIGVAERAFPNLVFHPDLKFGRF